MIGWMIDPKYVESVYDAVKHFPGGMPPSYAPVKKIFEKLIAESHVVEITPAVSMSEYKAKGWKAMWGIDVQNPIDLIEFDMYCKGQNLTKAEDIGVTQDFFDALNRVIEQAYLFIQTQNNKALLN
jgi:hypothetical protein